MTRFLLTLIALLTGLAAQVSPAQARVFGGGETEIGAVERAASAVSVAAQSALARGIVTRWGPPARILPAAARPVLRITVPTVQLGSDRSLD